MRAAASLAAESDRYIFRAGQVLLCAHWEGFLKKSADLYLEHIFSQDIRLCECTPNIIAIAYFKDVMYASEAKSPGSKNHHISLAKKIRNDINTKISKPKWQASTGGNPGTAELSAILESIGVDENLGMSAAEWSTTKVFINEQLLKDRHAVAHGQRLTIKKGDLLSRSERLLNLLDTVHDKLMDSAANKKYIIHSTELISPN